MNDERTIDPAEERMLDIALQHVLRTAPPIHVRRHAHHTLTAAVVLLGLAVTALTMWHGRAAAPSEAQEPESAPLPLPVRAEGLSALEALPADTQNLVAGLLRPDDIAVLRRFRKLRHLVLLPLDVGVAAIRTGEPLPVWQTPPADLLEPLTDLPALAFLQIGARVAVSPVVLQPLARCGALRTLELHGEQSLDAPFVGALRGVGALRELRFDLVRIDAAAVVRLRSLPLTSLHISRSPGFDAGAWRELCGWPTLERLSLSEFGRSFHWQGAELAFWMPTPEQLQDLDRMTGLRHLELDGCDLHDEHLAMLPANLTGLGLRSLELTPDGFRSLRRFTALRELDVTADGYSQGLLGRAPTTRGTAATDAIAEAMPALPLLQLMFTGTATQGLLQALGAHRTLRTLYLQTSVVPPIEALVQAPALGNLTLCDLHMPSTLTPDDLQPLRRSGSLRSLALHVFGKGDHLDPTVLRDALGNRIEAHVVRH